MLSRPSAIIPPIAFEWDGDTMRPRHARIADRHFVVGQSYALVEHHDRSQASHNHEFAWLAEAWRNLPGDLADQIPTPEHLRKRALIQAGFYDEAIVDAGSQAAALRVAADMRTISEFSMIVTRGSIVVRRTAKSQSRGAMRPDEFQASKQAILDVVSAMIGVEPAVLVKNAGMAA